MFVRCYCLERYTERLRGSDKNIETFPCPRCHSEFTLKSNQDVAEMPSNHFINNMLEIMSIEETAKASATCSRCKDPAINHCPSCKMFMCMNCSEWHNTWPAIENHVVLSIQELSNPESRTKMKTKLYCMKHRDKLIEIYCETCKELCCIPCLLSDHQKENHSCVALSELTQKERKTLQSSSSELDRKLSEGKEALNKICYVIKSLKENAISAKYQIMKRKMIILQIVEEKLDERAEDMSEEVDKVMVNCTVN